jgi:serine/threonine protein kinase
MRDRDAVDLAKRLLTFDHAERITARDALRHPFFARYLR